jgi:hypothetical protein
MILPDVSPDFGISLPSMCVLCVFGLKLGAGGMNPCVHVRVPCMWKFYKRYLWNCLTLPISASLMSAAPLRAEAAVHPPADPPGFTHIRNTWTQPHCPSRRQLAAAWGPEVSGPWTGPRSGGWSCVLRAEVEQKVSPGQQWVSVA